MIKTRTIRNTDYNAIVKVAESLSDWFDEDAREHSIPIDLRNQEGFVALCNGEIVGFITLFFAEGKLNIGWLGVHPEYQRKGIGTALLNCAEEYGLKHGITEIS